MPTGWVLQMFPIVFSRLEMYLLKNDLWIIEGDERDTANVFT